MAANMLALATMTSAIAPCGGEAGAFFGSGTTKSLPTLREC
jgi:hypothetical protein